MRKNVCTFLRKCFSGVSHLDFLCVAPSPHLTCKLYPDFYQSCTRQDPKIGAIDYSTEMTVTRVYGRQSAEVVTTADARTRTLGWSISNIDGREIPKLSEKATTNVSAFKNIIATATTWTY